MHTLKKRRKEKKKPSFLPRTSSTSTVLVLVSYCCPIPMLPSSISMLHKLDKNAIDIVDDSTFFLEEITKKYCKGHKYIYSIHP